jgi:lysyl-tRNA synthetase class 2
MLGNLYWSQIVSPGKLQLFLLLLGMIASFLFIRVSVRMIRAQVRWWPGNVSAGNVHVHHAVFGLLAMVVAGVARFAINDTSPLADILAVVFGMGTGLVLDEFALILHLEDVYWAEAGRASVTVTMLAILLTLFILVGAVPLDVDTASQHVDAARWIVVGLIAVHGLCVAAALLKGKLQLGLVSIFFMPLAIACAIRLAKPTSPWARRWYIDRPAKQARAERREAWNRAHWERWRLRVLDLVGGAPSETR